MTLYTDGVTGARGADGVYGDERLVALMGALPDDSLASPKASRARPLAYQGGTTRATTSRSSPSRRETDVRDRECR